MDQRTIALQEKAIKIVNDSKKMIWVTFRKEGIHQYNAAGHREDLIDVSFLRYPHRHVFHFKVWIEVMHTDRDIEFILFKRWLEELYSDKTLELNHKSCEMIADELYLNITAKYPDRDVWIEVAEDGENGCFNKYNKE
jgi:hypothetical protein